MPRGGGSGLRWLQAGILGPQSRAQSDFWLRPDVGDAEGREIRVLARVPGVLGAGWDGWGQSPCERSLLPDTSLVRVTGVCRHWRAGMAGGRMPGPSPTLEGTFLPLVS